MMKTITKISLKKQSGAALAVSLLLLVAMTILGVATLNGSRMAEKVASNAQQKAIAFEASESMINAIVTSDDIGARLLASRDKLKDPDPLRQIGDENLISDGLDQTSTFGVSVDVTTEGSIQFCGEFPAIGTSMDADESVASKTGLHYDIRGNTEITNSNARARHVIRIEDTGLRLGATGKCKTPGTK